MPVNGKESDKSFDQLNNISPGTKYTKNEADSNLSKGIITSLHTGIDSVNKMARDTKADKTWPGQKSDLPLERTTIIKKDGGVGIQIAEYSFKNSRTNKNNPSAPVVLHSTHQAIQHVPWYDTKGVTEINSPDLQFNLAQDADPRVAKDDKSEQYQKPVVTWVFKVPYLSDRAPYFDWIATHTNKLNSEVWTLLTTAVPEPKPEDWTDDFVDLDYVDPSTQRQGMTFNAYTLLIGGASTTAVLQEDGTVLHHGYWFFEWMREGWKKRRKLADGTYVQMLMFEAVDIEGKQVTTKYNPGGS